MLTFTLINLTLYRRGDYNLISKSWNKENKEVIIMKKIKKKIISMITSLLMTSSSPVSKAFEETDDVESEEYQNDYLDWENYGNYDPDDDGEDPEAEGLWEFSEHNDNYHRFLLALKIFSVAAAARLGMNLIYRLTRMLLAMKDMYCQGIKSKNWKNYFKSVFRLANKAYEYPELRDKVNTFLESFNEETNLDNVNIAIAVVAVSWYAGILKENLNSSLEEKLKKVIKKIADFFNLNGNLSVLSSGATGVVVKIGESCYKIGNMKHSINNYVKNAAGKNEINKVLSAEDNKYVKIYKSNKIKANPLKEINPGVLELDYCQPATMKKAKDLFRCVKNLCEGIAYLHSKNFVYKDIKLDNTVITKEEGTIKLKIIDPDEIEEEGTDMIRLHPTRCRLIDWLPFKKATKSLDIYMVGNTIEELLEKYKKTPDVENLSDEQIKSIKNYIDRCHAFFNKDALSYIVGDIEENYPDIS